ncbi:hypothetical protein QFC19_003476 [Naganishia cerealis]|uniref:Uncharacterized protein n=1 Tax=Naganishia cerealis TaxID=610337 RepID=A0ACC2W4E4_9TREE|nr:hypothetical protein QFC19_003476 [Naganishia cerealis]
MMGKLEFSESIVSEELPEEQGQDFKNIEKRVLRKFDFIIMPCLCLAYLFSTLDKANIGNAKVAGMSEELGLNGNQFGNVVSLLYITYVIIETPLALILKFIGAKYVLSVLCFLFGICCLCTALVTDYHSLLACRMLVGLFEAGIIPCINVYLSMLYTKKEVAKRCAAVYSAGAVSGAFGGLLAYGLTKINTDKWSGWQFLFAVEGGLTILAAPVIMFLLPRNAREAWWLNKEERKVLTTRLATYSDFHQDEKFMWSEVARGLMDINTVLVCLYQFCVDVTLFGISTFLPSIILGMGYDSYKTQLMTIPFYVVALFSFAGTCYFSDKTGHRGFFIAGGVVCEIVGYIILIASNPLGSRYFGCLMIGLGIYICSGLSVMWINNNNAGHYKRATAAGMCTTVGNSAGALAGQIYTADTAPRYFKGLKVALGLTCAALVFCSLMIYNYYLLNKKKERVLAAMSADEIDQMNANLAHKDTDLTFKYLL